MNNILHLMLSEFFTTSFVVPIIALILLAYIKSDVPHPISAGSDLSIFLLVYLLTAVASQDLYIDLLLDDFKPFGMRCLAISLTMGIGSLFMSTKVEKIIHNTYNNYLIERYKKGDFSYTFEKQKRTFFSLIEIKRRFKYIWQITTTHDFPIFRAIFCWIWVITIIGSNLYLIFGTLK